LGEFPRPEYNLGLRRISATLLLALFSFSLIGPVLFAPDAERGLPACCRRGGQHKCALSASQPASQSGPSWQAGKCGFFPAVKAVPPGGTVNLPGVSPAIFAGLASLPVSRPQTEALCRISYSRAGQKRGPPTLLS
jgi:hypothetical protein